MARDSEGASATSLADTTPIAEAGQHYLLQRDVAFLNHGSYGACPRPVFETYQRWQRELQAEPVEFLGRRLKGLLADARERLAEYVGTRATNIVFVPNTTHGINIVARSLDLQPGDEVLGTDHEYGAVERTWRFICDRCGAYYRSQHIQLPVVSRGEIVEQLWPGVTERTRVIVASHITSPTALIFPVEEICRRARKETILTVIDGAHAPGQLDMDLDRLGADFYVGNCHKWLSAPVGAGFLYARPEYQPLLKPLVVSWGWQARDPGPSPFHDLFDWIGTDDPSAYLSVPAAIAFQQEHEWSRVRTACHQLAMEARKRIALLTGLPQICPDTSDWWGQMCAVPLPVEGVMPAKDFQRRLWDECQVEVPATEWQSWRLLRVSIQAYNSPRDVGRLLDGLAHFL
ncbi:MAG TPA: aminotransferase class V-fold PLP-dependent enzyme [Ktedonobacterales bacterium]|nr:aminotransferase class V-fold PLP-dependent enzyme [Ktedonobacterales bacterium]